MSREKQGPIRNILARYGIPAGVTAGALAVGGALAGGIYLHNQDVGADDNALNTVQVCHAIRSSWANNPEAVTEGAMRDPSITIQYLASRLSVSRRIMSDGSWGAIEECQPTYGNPRNIPVSDEGSRAEIPNEPLAANELCMVIAHPFSTQNSSTQNNVWPKLLAFCPKVTP